MKPLLGVKKPRWDSDAAFIIKAALYLVLGSWWLTFSGSRLLPIGVIVGFFVSKIEPLTVNRRIDYALLIVGAFLGLYGIGIYLGW